MPRVTKPLTNTEIERTKPQGKSYTLTDGNGLFLLISATGSKTWQFNYYRPITNKRTKFSIGAYPEISLSQARAKREEFRALLANGVDPQVKAKEEKQAINTQIENSFLSVAEK
ncbi:integrase arm-type DNA-binding domain-containing protein [Gallibacterium anatis]|uniref:Integrase arm-type DNA-binding domain-containing protein n=1 Tax=Gallibacterium anatis TaxID=750 RepID=A0A921L0Q9_9PAST|nr:integrase arm-type DNA-binding domain-containing protein [Gallibacterium anatis]